MHPELGNKEEEDGFSLKVARARLKSEHIAPQIVGAQKIGAQDRQFTRASTLGVDSGGRSFSCSRTRTGSKMAKLQPRQRCLPLSNMPLRYQRHFGRIRLHAIEPARHPRYSAQQSPQEIRGAHFAPSLNFELLMADCDEVTDDRASDCRGPAGKFCRWCGRHDARFCQRHGSQRLFRKHATRSKTSPSPSL